MKKLTFVFTLAGIIICSQLALAQVGDYIDSEMDRIEKINNEGKKFEEAKKLFSDYIQFLRHGPNQFVAERFGMDPRVPFVIDGNIYKDFKSFTEFTNYYESKAYIGIVDTLRQPREKLKDLSKRVRDHRLISAFAVDVAEFAKEEIERKTARGLTFNHSFGEFWLDHPQSGGGNRLPHLSEVTEFLVDASQKRQTKKYTREVLLPIFKKLLEIDRYEVDRELKSVLKNDIWPQHHPRLVLDLLERERPKLTKAIIREVLSKKIWQDQFSGYETAIENLVASEKYDSDLVMYVFSQGRLSHRPDLILQLLARENANDAFIDGLNVLSTNSEDDSSIVETVITHLINNHNANKNVLNILRYIMWDRPDFWLSHQASFFEVANKAVDIDLKNSWPDDNIHDIPTYWVIKTLAANPSLVRMPEGSRIVQRINQMKLITSKIDDFDHLTDIALDLAQFEVNRCMSSFLDTL